MLGDTDTVAAEPSVGVVGISARSRCDIGTARVVSVIAALGIYGSSFGGIMPRLPIDHPVISVNRARQSVPGKAWPVGLNV